MRFAYPAVKQPQGSVHVADGSYGGAGISAQAGLVNHNGGRQVFDFVCPWLFELGQPAPDKGRIVFLSGFQGKYFSGCSGTTLVSQCCFDMTYHGSFFLLIFFNSFCNLLLYFSKSLLQYLDLVFFKSASHLSSFSKIRCSSISFFT